MMEKKDRDAVFIFIFIDSPNWLLLASLFLASSLGFEHGVVTGVGGGYRIFI